MPTSAEALPVARVDSQPQALAPSTSTADLMRYAMDKGPEGVAMLRELMAMKREQDVLDAARAYNAAMAAFQAECPPIPREGKADYATNAGGAVKYDFAKLDTIKRVAGPFAAKHGLSWTFRTEYEGNKIKTICVMRHAAGHIDDSSFFISPIDGMAKMSETQKTSGTETVGMRQSLRKALGLSSTEPDNDGAGGDAGEVITPDQVTILDGYINESRVDRDKFLKWAGADILEGVMASRFDSCVAALKARIKAAGKS